MGEYAKFVRLYAPTSNAAGRGMQARFTLPSTKNLGGEYDYINYYVGIGGYEIGVSTARKPEFLRGGSYKWHWFVNTSNGDKKDMNQPVQYSDGDSVTVKIFIDQETKKLKLYLNGSSSPSYTSNNEWYGTMNDCRVVLGAFQSSGDVPPLASWKVSQSNVTVSNIYYRNASDTWVPITSGSPTVFHKPAGVSNPGPADWRASNLSGGSFTANIG